MPSPIGHALGGIAAGAVVSRGARWETLALFALLGAVPDIDILLPIPHRGPTHSIVSAVLVFLVAWPALAWFRPAADGPSPVRLALAIAAAWGSHILLDWLGADSSTPQGLMALWPLTTTHYISGLDVFLNISRRYWLPGFWRHNAVAVTREILILGPVLLAGQRLARPSARRTRSSTRR
jgi:inner membrane protein